MSDLVVLGLNYHAHPIAIRERFTIPESCLEHALTALTHLPHVQEAVLLSTCNRTEVYAIVNNLGAGLAEIESFFVSARSVSDHDSLRPNFRLLRDDAALHLFRVAAGLDSLVLGEGQIMSQVKASHQAALRSNSCGPTLDRLFKLALVSGKRVRTQTAIGRRAVSISSAAVELGRKLLKDFNEKTILVIGAGKMGSICLKHLLSDNIGSVFLANRNLEKSKRFLQNNLRYIDRVFLVDDFAKRHQVAAEVDLVIVCSGAPDYVITTEELLAKRQSNRPLLIIDIAVPRNVAPEVSSIEGVSLYNADDLSVIVNENLKERESLVCDAESIVFEVLKDFQNWQSTLVIVPTITELRQKIESIRISQMEKSLATGTQSNQSANDTGMRQEVDEVTRAIINEILHQPTINLKSTGDYQVLYQHAELLRSLFNLDPLGAGGTVGTRQSVVSVQPPLQALPSQHLQRVPPELRQ